MEHTKTLLEKFLKKWERKFTHQQYIKSTGKQPFST